VSRRGRRGRDRRVRASGHARESGRDLARANGHASFHESGHVHGSGRHHDRRGHESRPAEETEE